MSCFKIVVVVSLFSPVLHLVLLLLTFFIRSDCLFQHKEHEAHKLNYLYFNSSRFNSMNYSGFPRFYLLFPQTPFSLSVFPEKDSNFTHFFVQSSFVDVDSGF